MSTDVEEQPKSGPVPLAIVGMGCLFPKADSPEAFWANIKGGVDAVTEIPATHWRPEDYFDGDASAPDMTYARRGAFIEPVDFNPLEFGIAPNNIEATDTTQLLGMYVAQQALRDAGYATGKDAGDGRAFNRARTSVILGVTGALELVIPLGARLGHPIWRRALKAAGVEQGVADDVVRRIADAYVPWQENSFPGLLGNVAAGRIANRFDLGGTNSVVDAACASSLAALHMAAMELYAGRSDMAITGGIDTFNDIFMYMCFSKTPALSPTGNSRPFSAGGDGTILGEGLGVVVLKRLADAQRDGDRIHAVIRSIGTSSDGKGNAVYAPSADGQVRCLLSAYEQAGVSPRTIELVEAHGTGTKVGDAVEAKALAEVYRTDKGEGTWCALGSVKSMVGHTKAAAGIAGLIKAAMALEQKVLPPTIKVDRPLEVIEPGKAPVYVNAQSRPWLARGGHPRRAGVSAFGFGGSNFHCVLEEATPVKAEADWDDSVLLLAWSGESAGELDGALGRLDAGAEWKQLRAESHRLRGEFRADATCRLAIVVQKGQGDLGKVVRGARQMLSSGQAGRASWSTPDGAYFGSGKAAGKLGVIFPGQGSQYAGMLRDLACQFTEFLETLAEADGAFGSEEHGRRLSDFVYPISAFSDDARAADERKLSDTRVAQPAIGAVSLAAWRVLGHFGVRAEAAAGHSFGELVALCAAGRIDGAGLHELARARGEAMGGADRGGMLAVAAPIAEVARLIASEKLDLVIANKNAPSQVVLSGALAEIERAAGVCEAKGLRCRRLAVSAAFHSPLVAGARGAFEGALGKVKFGSGAMPVYANTTADLYPAGAERARETLARQIAEPVEFVAEIEKMHGSGVRTFLEVGPGNKMAGLVRAILGERGHHAVSLDASTGKRPGVYDLGCALAQVAVLGHGVDLTKWDAAFGRRVPAPQANKKPAVTIRLSGANYVKPRPALEPRVAVVAAAAAAEVQSATLPPPRAVPQLTEEGSTRLNSTPEQSPPGRLAPAVTQPIPVPVTAPPVAAAAQASPDLTHALQTTQQSILALQRMQEQTALLHQQYLQGQEVAQRTIHQLVEQQMRFLGAACGVGAPAAAAAPVGYQAAQIAPIAPAPMIQPTVVGEPVRPVVAPVVAAAPVSAAYSGNGAGQHKPVVAAPAIEPAPVMVAKQAEPTPVVLAAVAAVAAPSDDRVQVTLLEVVADKTGYPVEMLELDMSLDSDLGIDSIKRVEILSALQTRLPEAPIVKPEDLGRLQTLRQIVDFLQNGTATVKVATPVVEKPVLEKAAVAPRKQSAHAAAAATDVLDRRVLTVVPLDGGAAREPLALPASGRVWVTDDGAGLAARVCQALAARKLDARTVGLDAKPGNDALAGLLILAPAKPGDDFIKSAFQLIRRAGPALRKGATGGGAFLVSASRLDGAFALNGHAPGSALTGGLAGLVKTAGHEWPGVACKSLDLAGDADAERLAKQIADEVLLKGPTEVGLSADGRCETRLVRAPLNGEVGEAAIGAGDLVVITGGARGVTAEVSVALAREYRCSLLLLGRSAAPMAEPGWLAGVTGEAQVKKAIAAREGGLSPRALEEQFRRAMINREMLATLKQIEAAGATVAYRSLDVRGAGAVAAAVAEMRKTAGPVRAVIHGAGVLQDRLIEEKTDEQFDEVYSTKVDGLEALLAAVRQDDVRVIVAFSSSTGRFGRKGQVAYAAANEVLNKLAQQEARRRPGCRVLSINWGPWEGGMVTPNLRKIFENEGVGLIPLRAGADYLMREMATPAGGPVEIVILGPGPDARANGNCESNGAAIRLDARMSAAFERDVDVESFPMLRHHVIKGRAVLPMAIVLEWLAHGAMHEHPGMMFHGVDDLRIFKGVVLDPRSRVTVQVLAGPAVTRDGTEVVPVELRSGPTLHARADIVLTSSIPAGRATAEPAATRAYPAVNGEIYRDGRLFHGTDLHGIEAVDGWSEEGIVGRVSAAPAPAAWMERPMRSAWLADPLALDASFQLMILWCFEARGVGSLPTRLARYRQYCRAFPRDGVRVVIRTTEAGEHSAEATIEFVDRAGGLVARMDGYQCVMDATLGESFAGNQLVEEQARQ